MEDLINAARNGDKAAFGQIMRRFQDRAFSVALAQLSDHHLSEDAVQEAFVEAFLRLGQLQDVAAFPAWLHKIVLGKCVRAIRSGKSVTASIALDALVDIEASGAGPEAAMQEKMDREAIEHAIRQLSDQEREAFLLFSVGGYRYAEIGQLLDLSPSLVKKRIYTARQRLREGEELAALRPSRHPKFAKRVVAAIGQRTNLREEILMSETMLEEYAVDLVGPGIEYKTAIKNLYVYYRYEMLMSNHYDLMITPPQDATDETWKSGAWVNQNGVINGIASATHDEATAGEDAFWQWPNLQAYLIRLNGWPAGFALVASPPNATRGVDYRLQEFFVINKARRRGVGAAAARMLFDRLPGRWELAYEPENLPAVAFWRKFIAEYTGGDFAEEMIGMGSSPDVPGYVFTKGARPVHPIVAR